MSEQTTLHSDVYERLQASIHYVLRHYAENLEEVCISGLNEARRDRYVIVTMCVFVCIFRFHYEKMYNLYFVTTDSIT
jgi:hypothetical protein